MPTKSKCGCKHKPHKPHKPRKTTKTTKARKKGKGVIGNVLGALSQFIPI
jgi:hypothetical protein